MSPNGTKPWQDYKELKGVRDRLVHLKSIDRKASGLENQTHVEREDNIAKYWLDPVRLQGSGGLSRVEIGRIEKLVSKHQSELMEAWDEYFHD